MNITIAEQRVMLALQRADACQPTAVLELPMALPSVANLREHHHVKAARVALQRAAVRMAWRQSAAIGVRPPCIVRMVRLAPRSLDDDNAASAFKAIRDSIAERLGVDDRDASVTWLVGQEKAKVPAVRVEVYSMGGGV